MLLKEAKDLSLAEIRQILLDGGKVVVYPFVISVVLMTFKRASSPYLFRAGESRFVSGIMFSLITLCFGWWGIPWGPIYSIQTLFQNAGGGVDITDSVLKKLDVSQTNATESQRAFEEQTPRSPES